MNSKSTKLHFIKGSLFAEKETLQFSLWSMFTFLNLLRAKERVSGQSIALADLFSLFSKKKKNYILAKFLTTTCHYIGSNTEKS